MAEKDESEFDYYDLNIASVAEPIFGEQVGEGVVRTHGQAQCTGRNCVIHNPSDHHMRTWKMNFRMDKMALVERICPHGIGHPDPDSAAYFESIGEGSIGVHGCDGCCHA